MPPSISTVRVLGLEPFGPGGEYGSCYALRLEMPAASGWRDWAPGQYVMLRPEAWGREMTWPRPLSICMAGGELLLFFQVVGRGTARLAQLRQGEAVQVAGPLGTSFQVESKSPTLLLAGGMGMVPFVGYARKHPNPDNVKMLFGHRAAPECYPFEHLDPRVAAEKCHDAGPEDLAGFLARIDAAVAENVKNNGLTLACGPLPFLRAVQSICLRRGARAQISLEGRMACGVGACLGCVVKPLLNEAGSGNRSAQAVPEQMHKALPVPACTCGPVFWADSVDLSSLA